MKTTKEAPTGQLPVLPEPCIYEGDDSPLYDAPTGYVVEQLQAYGQQCAAHALQVQQELLSSQAERIKELEKACDKYSEAEILLNSDMAKQIGSLRAQLAERIKEFEQVNAFNDSVIGSKNEQIVALENERDTLRARIAEITATEPVAWRYKINATEYWQFTSSQLVEKMEETVVEPLFTRPMPIKGIK